jgi:hypothetical protein
MDLEMLAMVTACIRKYLYELRRVSLLKRVDNGNAEVKDCCHFTIVQLRLFLTSPFEAIFFVFCQDVAEVHQR